MARFLTFCSEIVNIFNRCGLVLALLHAALKSVDGSWGLDGLTLVRNFMIR